jgi:CheY-like chemotaxis protein
MTSPNTVLLVEDNSDNLLIYSTALRHHGYHVVEATDGEAALAAARTVAPDVILMDVAIPLIDGWEVTRRLKGDPSTAGIPVVALTAHALDTDREKAMAVGCDRYISKPAAPQVVIEAVKKYARRAPAQSIG